jgi:hypothetical protein
VRGFALYSEDKGRILLGYEIDHLGRPRVPMRDACHDILKQMEFSLPQQNVGFTLHNSVLGVLAHKEHAGYSKMLDVLASHFVHRVRLTATSYEQGTVHMFACQKAAKDAPITYEKGSFTLAPLPKK